MQDPQQVIQAAASSMGVEASPIQLRDPAGIERDITAFARDPDGGLIVAVSAVSQLHRELIITLAARHQLPAAYPYRFFVTQGGLISYGPDLVVLYRRAASYIDRILRGDKPADLPVYELAINLKAAKALGITVPLILQQRADEVIE
jgi:putative ABC transport system substrate-binding protein